MIGRSALMAGTVLSGLMTALPAAAQTTLEDRVRALEQALGVTPQPALTLEQRVQAIEARLARGAPAVATAPAAAAPVVAQTPIAPAPQPAPQPAPGPQIVQAAAEPMRTAVPPPQAPAAPTWSYDFNRATIRSADNNFQLAFRGRFQFDSGVFFQDDALAPAVSVGRDLHNGANFRRAQIGFEGRVYRDFNYEFVYDFGSSGTERSGQIYLLRLAYTGIPNLTINGGAIQPKFTLNDSTSLADITFLERASIVNTILDPFGGSDSRRGVELIFQKAGLFRGGDNLLISTAFTGERIAAIKTDDEGSQLLGRAAYRFYSDATSNYQIGVDVARIMNKPNGVLAFGDRPETRVDGTQLVGFGTAGLPTPVVAKTAWLYGFEAAMNRGPFYIAGEYYKYGLERTNSALKDPTFGGWYVEASYFLTGHTRPYNAAAAAFTSPAIPAPFDLNAGTWGAWEAKARYSVNDLNALETDANLANRVLGGEQHIISLGANWYLNRNVRWMFDYLIVDVDRKDAGGAQAGQDFTAFMNRLQFSF